MARKSLVDIQKDLDDRAIFFRPVERLFIWFLCPLVAFGCFPKRIGTEEVMGYSQVWIIWIYLIVRVAAEVRLRPQLGID